MEAGITLDELLDLAGAAWHTRYPVFAGDIDHLIGVLNIQDLVQRDSGRPPVLADRLMAASDGTREEETDDFVLDGHAGITEIEDMLGISLAPTERNYETVAGLIMAETGDIPTVGDSEIIRDHVVSVLAMDGWRVVEVRLRALASARAEEGART